MYELPATRAICDRNVRSRSVKAAGWRCRGWSNPLTQSSRILRFRGFAGSRLNGNCQPKFCVPPLTAASLRLKIAYWIELSMSRQDALQGSLPLMVLTILARRGPLHGYGITERIESISGDVLRVEEGSLYPALHRIEETGWVKAKWVTTPNKRRARIYEITAAGRKQLEDEETRWLSITAAVNQVLQKA